MSWPNQKKFEDYLRGMKDSLSEKRINAIAELATREFRYYKHAVLCLERHLKHSRSHSRLGIAYVLDAILKRGKSCYKHKDPFPKRFSKNMKTTLKFLLDCNPKDKAKIVKLIKFWLKSRSFSDEAEDLMEDSLQRYSDVDRNSRSSHHNDIRDRRKESPQKSNTGDLLSSLDNLNQDPRQEPAAPVNDSFDDILGSFDYGDEENEDDRIAEQKRRLEQQRMKASGQLLHSDIEPPPPKPTEPEAPPPVAPPLEQQHSAPERAYGPPLAPPRAYGPPPVPDRYGRGPPMPPPVYGRGPPPMQQQQQHPRGFDYGAAPPPLQADYGPLPEPQLTPAEQALVNERGWAPSPNQTQVPPGMVKVLSTTLYVGGIAPDQTSADLNAKFESYGQIVDIRVLKSSAFIKFSSRNDAESAKELISSYHPDLKIGWGKGSHLDSENFDNQTGIGLVPLKLVSNMRLPPPPPPMRPHLPMQGPPHPPAGYGAPPGPPGPLGPPPGPPMSPPPRRPGGAHAPPPDRYQHQSPRAGPPPGIHPDRWNENFRPQRDNEASHQLHVDAARGPSGPPPHMHPDRWRMSSASRPRHQGRDSDRESPRSAPPPPSAAAAAAADGVDARPPPVSMAASGAAGPPPHMHPDRWRQKMAAESRPPPSDGGRQRPRKRSRWDT